MDETTNDSGVTPATGAAAPAGQPPSSRPAPGQAKLWWQSRTHAFNAAMALVAAAEANLHILQPLLPVNSFAGLSFALIVGNTVLRQLTSAPLVLRADPADAQGGGSCDGQGSAP